MEVKMLLLAVLLAALEVRLVAGSRHGHSMPGSPHNISTSDHSIQHAVLTCAYSFNNQSNDAFLFKPSAIHRAQRQIVKGTRDIIDLDISRTVCRKRHNNNNNNLSACDFQPAGRLHQTLRCHLEVWVVPWQNLIRTLTFSCKP